MKNLKRGLLSVVFSAVMSCVVTIAPYLPVPIVTTVAISQAGCPTAKQWFDIVGALLPIIGQTYLQFYGFAKNEVPDAGDIALVQNLTTSGQDAIKQVEAIVRAYQTSPDTSKLGEIKAVLAQLQLSADAFLKDAQIKNSTRFAQYSAFAHALLADVTDVIALVPVLVPAVGGARGVTVVKTPVYRKAKALEAVFRERLSKLPT